MTQREQAVWSCVYAAAWCGPQPLADVGRVTDESRARFAVGQAERAVAALVRCDEDRREAKP